MEVKYAWESWDWKKGAEVRCMLGAGHEVVAVCLCWQSEVYFLGKNSSFQLVETLWYLLGVEGYGKDEKAVNFRGDG